MDRQTERIPIFVELGGINGYATSSFAWSAAWSQTLMTRLEQLIEVDMRGLTITVVFIVTAIAIAVMPVASQVPTQKPSFEVASVKACRVPRNSEQFLS